MQRSKPGHGLSVLLLVKSCAILFLLLKPAHKRTQTRTQTGYPDAFERKPEDEHTPVEVIVQAALHPSTLSNHQQQAQTAGGPQSLLQVCDAALTDVLANPHASAHPQRHRPDPGRCSKRSCLSHGAEADQNAQVLKQGC